MNRKEIKMKKIFAILSISLVVVFALILAVAVYAQGPGDGERDEGGEIGGQGIADPPPAGWTAVYMFTGVVDNTPGADTVATSVLCTNYGSAGTDVRVEFIDFDNNPVISGTTTIDPNESQTFSTQATAIYWDDVPMTVSDSIDQGSGRVLISNSAARIICTAQVLDPNNNPPEFMINLDLFRP
jgi:hypothetical protein